MKITITTSIGITRRKSIWLSFAFTFIAFFSYSLAFGQGDLKSSRGFQYSSENDVQEIGWEFETGPEIWTNVNAAAGTATVTDGALVFNITAVDPWAWSAPFAEPLVVGDMKYLWLRIKNETTDGTGEFYVFPAAGGMIHYPFSQSTSDTDYKDIYLDLSANGMWLPELAVSTFRFDPITANGGETGTVSLDFIRISSIKPPPQSFVVKGKGDATEINGLGSTLQMIIEVAPALGNTDATWTVDNEAFATIDANGLLTAVSPGEVTVTATSKFDSNVTASVVITVTSNVVLVTGLEVVSDKYDIKGIGNTLQMSVNIIPSNASNKNVTWSVDDPSVATIDPSSGLLTSVATGTVVVTATSLDGTDISESKEVVVYTGQKNAWEFKYDLEGWTTVNAGNVSVVDGAMAFEVTGDDPWVNGPVVVPVWSAYDIDTLWLRIKNSTADESGELFIFLDGVSGGGFTTVIFPLTPNDTEFRDIKIDMTTNPQWNNDLKVAFFRLDPIGGNSTGMVYIDFIRFIPNNTPPAWDSRPSLSFTTQYEQVFADAWDGDVFYNQWDAVSPGIFTAADIESGYLQYVWVEKRILLSKNTYTLAYILEAELDYSAGSSRGGVIIRAEANGPVENVQEPASGDPGFNREGIAFYPSDDGSAMTVQLTGAANGSETPVTRIMVPKPADVTSLRDRGTLRIEDYGSSIYVFYNDAPFIRIDLGEVIDNKISSGVVYNSEMQVIGTFADMEVEVTGKVAIAQRDAALRLYRATVKINATIPGAPANVSASLENVQATVTFTAPASNGGLEITSYTVTSDPGNISQTGTGSPIVVTGLNSNTTYTFTVVATNAVGNSISSAMSNEVTTTYPVGITDNTSDFKIYQANSAIIADLKGLNGLQTISFYDLQGKCLVSRQAFGGEKLEITNEMKTGVYIVRIQGEEKILQTKIMIR